jgi:hypothetical protein
VREANDKTNGIGAVSATLMKYGLLADALMTFVSVIFDKQTGCQAELARTQGKQETVCKRLLG